MFAVDLVQRALPLREPHPRSFNRLAVLLAGGSISLHSLAEYQWELLDEAGHRPDLGERADGEPEPDVVYFVPSAGRVELARPIGSDTAWPMRRGTLEALRSITRDAATSQRPQTPERTDTWTRAAAFLCSYWMWVLGRSIPTARAVFGDRIELSE